MRGRPVNVESRRKKRQEIMRASVNLFASNGYENTSVQMIADHLNINVASLYYYFKNKEAILFEFLESALIAVIQQTREAMAAAGDTPAERLGAFVRAHVLFQFQILSTSSAYSLKSLALAGRDDESYMDRLNELENENLDDLKTVLREGQEAGVFAILDLTVTAFAIIGIIEQVNQWFRENARLSADEVADLNAALALRMAGLRNA